MKILIYGIGGVGGYFGAKMAKAGYEVTMIARENTWPPFVKMVWK